MSKMQELSVKPLSKIFAKIYGKSLALIRPGFLKYPLCFKSEKKKNASTFREAIRCLTRIGLSKVLSVLYHNLHRRYRLVYNYNKCIL